MDAGNVECRAGTKFDMIRLFELPPELGSGTGGSAVGKVED